MIKLSTFISVIIISVALLSCDAPRLNPLDPENSGNGFGQITGRVYAYPHQTLEGVRVVWKNQNILAVSDTNGQYSFVDIQTNDGYVYFEKEGFSSDTIKIEWENQKQKSLDDVVLNYTTGKLTGRVYAYPHQALQGVNVIWKNQNVLAVSDVNGQYSFSDIQTNDGYIYLEKDGFTKDSIKVTWNNQNQISLDEVVLKYTIGQLFGYVKRESIPRTGIQGAKVFWKNENMLIQTDALGYYSFNNIPYENGYLYFEKDGFTSDTVFIEFDNQQSLHVPDRFLNSIPELQQLLIYTTVLNQQPDQQKISLSIQAIIHDEDGQSDIDTVFLKCDDLDFSIKLTGGAQNIYQSSSLTAADLNLSSIDGAVGKLFEVYVEDKSGITYKVGSSNIKRIIKQVISVESPANRVVTTSKPTLRWGRFKPGFNFTYSLAIKTDEVISNVVWTKSGISSEDVETIVDKELPAGDYYWIVTCVDEFNDQATSSPGSFTVQ